MDDESKIGVWGAAVTFAHLAIAVGGMILTLGGFALINERRITTVEERQQFVIRHMTENAQEEAAFRAEVLRRMDAVSAQMIALQIELAKHQASAEVRRMFNEQQQTRPQGPNTINVR